MPGILLMVQRHAQPGTLAQFQELAFAAWQMGGGAVVQLFLLLAHRPYMHPLPREPRLNGGVFEALAAQTSGAMSRAVPTILASTNGAITHDFTPNN